QLPYPFLHRDSHMSAILGMSLIIHIFRISEKYHQGITDKFVDGSSEFYSDLCHFVEIPIGHLGKDLRVYAVRNFSKSNDIGKKNGQKFTLVTEISLPLFTEDQIVQLW